MTLKSGSRPVEHFEMLAAAAQPTVWERADETIKKVTWAVLRPVVKSPIQTWRARSPDGVQNLKMPSVASTGVPTALR